MLSILIGCEASWISKKEEFYLLNEKESELRLFSQKLLQVFLWKSCY